MELPPDHSSPVIWRSPVAVADPVQPAAVNTCLPHCTAAMQSIPISPAELPVGDVSARLSQDEPYEKDQFIPADHAAFRPHCPTGQLISRDTLYIRRLPLSLQYGNPGLVQELEFPKPSLRTSISFLCWRKPVQVNFVLDGIHVHTAEIEPGLTIFSFFLLQLYSQTNWSWGHLHLLDEDPNKGAPFHSPYLSFYLEGDVQLVGGDGQPVFDPVPNNHFFCGE